MTNGPAHTDSVGDLHEPPRAPACVFEPRERRALFFRGVVQGVGLRPVVYRLATRFNLGGFVCNRADGVVIEIEGARSRLSSFLENLSTDCPALAQIAETRVSCVPPRGESVFRIEQSDVSSRPQERVFCPDLATCDACLKELFEPSDRRFGYPFINCTQCGPRFTIVYEAPYDRVRTTMAAFEMCAACRAEYRDPTDRRFHAQPTACPECGPQLTARDADGGHLDVQPLSFFEDLLRSEAIIAVKGLGGYHLACDATSEAAVERLRHRKCRREKPFAVLVPDLDAAGRLCQLSEVEAALLSTPRRPIVLLQRLADARVAHAVAPNSPLLGVMLPYTPLHHLLARQAGGRPLVLTSGNRRDEPIAFEDASAFAALHGIADGFLTHDRPIRRRCDDSIARAVENRPFVLRRSRGYAPEPIHLPMRCTRRILALGGQLKNVFALGRGDQAILSHHGGDLGDYRAYRSFCEAIADHEALYEFEPELLVHDWHPGYATTEYAKERHAAAPTGVRLIAVQHHHAHMASCMAENGVLGSAIGVTFDGTGYGNDGSLWGGEFLIGDYRTFHRAAHLREVELPGGEQAIREPWRMAVAHLADCGEESAPYLPGIAPASVRLLGQMIDRRINCPLTSSAGRFFDAVAALVNGRTHVTFEGQAAMELESLAGTSEADGSYPFAVEAAAGKGGVVVDTRPVVRAILEALREGDAAAHIARRFHNTIARIIVDVTRQLSVQTGIDDVVLTGGVFQNAVLLGGVRRGLEALGLRVHSHARVPANDGGLCLGQLAVAAALLEGEP
jgi:hydrogenase maturation protein HypF